MRRIVALLVVSGLLACAGTPVLPRVGSGATSAADDERAVPTEPEAQWHLSPTAEGVALELRF